MNHELPSLGIRLDIALKNAPREQVNADVDLVGALRESGKWSGEQQNPFLVTVALNSLGANREAIIARKAMTVAEDHALQPEPKRVLMFADGNSYDSLGGILACVNYPVTIASPDIEIPTDAPHNINFLRKGIGGLKPTDPASDSSGFDLVIVDGKQIGLAFGDFSIDEDGENVFHLPADRLRALAAVVRKDGKIIVTNPQDTKAIQGLLVIDKQLAEDLQLNFSIKQFEAYTYSIRHDTVHLTSPYLILERSSAQA